MVNPESLRRRLQKIDECLSILRESQRYDYEAFAASPERYGSVERFLQLAIEALSDLGNHLIADRELGRVEAYRDIPNILAANGFITDDQRKTWIEMIGFRNVLVHDYVAIDRRIVFDVLQNRLNDIEALHRVFVALL